MTNPQAYHATKLIKSVQNITVQPIGVNAKKKHFLQSKLEHLMESLLWDWLIFEGKDRSLPICQLYITYV